MSEYEEKVLEHLNSIRNNIGTAVWFLFLIFVLHACK